MSKIAKLLLTVAKNNYSNDIDVTVLTESVKEVQEMG